MWLSSECLFSGRCDAPGSYASAPPSTAAGRSSVGAPCLPAVPHWCSPSNLVKRRVRVDAVVNKPHAELLLVISHVFSLAPCAKSKEFKVLRSFVSFFPSLCHSALPFPGGILTLVSCYSETSNLIKAIPWDLLAVKRKHKGPNAFPPFPRMYVSSGEGSGEQVLWGEAEGAGVV